MYQPGSKYKTKSTGGGELVEAVGGKEYVGDYIELSDGRTLSGTRPGALYQQLLIPIPIKTKKNYQDTNNEKYAILKPSFEEFYNNLSPVVSTKLLPTEEDYMKFKYDRYFAKKSNSKLGYIEIDKKTYKKIIQENEQYDYYIYQAGKIQWSLKEGSADVNFFMIKEMEKEFPGLSSLYPDLQEFYIPDEISEPKTQTAAAEEDLKPLLPDPPREQLKDPEVPQVVGLEKVQDKMLDNLRKKIKDRTAKKLKAKNVLTKKDKFKPGKVVGGNNTGGGGASGGGSGGGGGGY